MRRHLSGRLRVRLTAVAATALLLSIVTLIARAKTLSNAIELILAVASPLAPWLALLGLVLSLACRRTVLSLTAVAIVALTVGTQVHWYYAGHPVDVRASVEIRVLSSNLRKGQADASSFVGMAKDTADVIAVSELTPEEARHFGRAGIDDVFPHSVLKPAPGAGGIGLWSRFPLAELQLPKDQRSGYAAARLRVPGVRFDPLVASLHITSPVTAEPNSFDRWRNTITDMKTRLADFAEAAGPAAVIVAGDFNSTPDMRQFRDLLTNSYRDAVEQMGAGFAPTFPSNKWFPPVLVIDHVVTRNATASSIRTVDILGSDHRALLATIRVPLDPKLS